jgi:hypothetical protein
MRIQNSGIKYSLPALRKNWMVYGGKNVSCSGRVVAGTLCLGGTHGHPARVPLLILSMT